MRLKRQWGADEQLAHGEYRDGCTAFLTPSKMPSDQRHSDDFGFAVVGHGTPGRRDLRQRLKNNGAIIIGKTNTPEFGMGSQTYNTIFGTTLNAYAQAKTAGGSSGGAAVSWRCACCLWPMAAI